MNILLVGSGGREHALAWKIAASPLVKRLVITPGNPGMASLGELRALKATDVPGLVALAQEIAADLVVIGSEASVEAGLADALNAASIPCFGPVAAAGKLESSKAFTKAFTDRHGLPTSAYKVCESADDAKAALAAFQPPYVIKADGLAAGKGVVVAMTLEEAHQAVDMMLSDNQFGDAGARIVIEEFLAGEEASFIVMCDGKNILPLATSQDHKRLKDHDQGPNTGGMGAYSPAPIVTPAMHARVMREIIVPTIQGMAKDGITFTGFLYAGLMIDDKGTPKTLEFNCRMGDPETQPIMARLKTDLVTVMEHAVNGTLDAVELEWDRRTAVGVVMAAAGYPDDPVKGTPIGDIPAETVDAITFHAGTRIEGERLVTNGGRVLCVVGLGDSIKMAQKQAYETVEKIHFDGAQYRRDIGWRGLKH